MRLIRRACCIIAVLVSAPAALAHEMFLLPSEHYVEPRATVTVALFNGSFDSSENPTTRDRMKSVLMAANGKMSGPSEDKWWDDRKASYLDLKFGGEGTYAIGVSTKPKVIVLSADNFDDYLRHDGVVDILAAREAARTPDRPQVRELYSKHVRTIVQVGDIPTDDYATPFGFPAEILLQTNPTDLKAGATLAFQVMVRGKPASSQPVYASYAGHHGHDAEGGHTHAAVMRTDQNGVASFAITNPGRWFITLIHMEPVDAREVDYESNWSTVTFEVR